MKSTFLSAVNRRLLATAIAAAICLPVPVIRAADPVLPPDALVTSTSKTLPPEHPDDHLPAVAGSVAVDWTNSIRDLPGEAWGINDYEILNPKLAADAGYNQFLQKTRPTWVRIHNFGMPQAWLDASGKAWDAAKIKACFAGARGLADTKLMMNVSRWPDWMKDEQGLVRRDCRQAYADLYVDLMRILRDEVKLKIEYWEIMNETDGPYDKAKRLNDLWDVYNTVAVAMKTFDPQAKVGGIAFTWANRQWVEGFAKNCLTNADFVTYHNYGTGDMYDSNEKLFGKLSSMEDSARSVRKIADRYAAGRHVPVFLGEYNVKWEWTPIERRHGNSVGSVFHAGVVRRAMLAGVDGAAIWHLKGNAYGLIDGDNGIRPASHLFVWAPRLLVGKMMDVKASDSLEVLAVIRADGGRSVLIANKANHTVELGSVAALGLAGTGPVEMRQVNSRSVVDGVAAPPSLSLPGYSVTILSTAR